MLYTMFFSCTVVSIRISLTASRIISSPNRSMLLLENLLHAFFSDAFAEVYKIGRIGTEC